MVFTSVPNSITPEVVRGCGQIGITTLPVFVDVSPAPSALPNKCILNVLKWLETNDGQLVLGWKVNLWSGVLVELIGHSVIRSKDALLHCITPDQFGSKRILFLEDARITYDPNDPLSRMPVKRVPLTNHRDVATFIAIEEKITAIKSKYPPTSGPIAVHGDDAATLEKLEKGKRNAFRDLALRVWRNADPCPCESGKSFASCCRSGMSMSQRAARAR